ncbi:proton-conducting transporter membrane subunit [Candidatus Parabeggiatoa sp. HSG14]|uniref:proton-conducting transporter transmembrane domain-containing protein n=1 Tax=Candidatus Parabeggiatoa sp. HSG14 TaxID=3055593 RepID=UPI0025A7EE04|nr:proton-conducting transporter membrane subunit [Thiotrichales bacterium HSG14]
MNLLNLLLLISLATVPLIFWLGTKRFAGWFGVIAYATQLIVLIALWDKMPISSSFSFTVLDNVIHWQMTGLGWFFAIITVGAALFSSWYTAGEWGAAQKDMRQQHVALALNVLAMLILLSSGDFLSLFIGWELVSWAGYLMMTHRGGKAADAAFRYLIYAMSGTMAILAGIALVYSHVGSFDFGSFWNTLSEAPTPLLWAYVLLFGSGFLVKMAMMPFHLWQADAYAETPGANSAFLNAISARMGLFALALVLLQPMGAARLAEMTIPFTFLDARSLFMWIAALTAIIPTYIALQQSDARLLLTWHGVGQGGFMLLGIALATPMGVAGGLMHVFNYATYQAALFLAVTAVMYRAGTTDLDRLGGLITRMPLTYVALLMGIIGLAGLPPMNGFVSKWMIYKTLLDEKLPLLLVAASISTLGTILSVYKLIHNIFLGQLRKEHYELKEAPWTMTLPMLVLAGIAFITGVFPGLVLSMVDQAQAALGFALIHHHIEGIPWETGGLNMAWVTGIFFYGLGIGAIIFFFLGNKRFIVHQWDNYAGGHFLSSDVPYNYTHNFYPGVMRVIKPWFKGTIVKLEQALIHLTQLLGSAFHGFYRVSYTPIYLLMVTVLALAWVV